MRRFSRLKLIGGGGNLPGTQEAKKGLQLAATRRRRRCSRPKPQWRPLTSSRRNKKPRRGWNLWQPAGHARNRGCVERCGNLRGAPKAKTRQQLVATTSRCLKPKLQWRPPKARTKAISGHSRRAGSPRGRSGALPVSPPDVQDCACDFPTDHWEGPGRSKIAWERARGTPKPSSGHFGTLVEALRVAERISKCRPVDS